MRYTAVRPARFLSRPNRFIAQVELDGQEETVHVKNTGRCRELLLPGRTIYLEESSNPSRKTRFDLGEELSDVLITFEQKIYNKHLDVRVDLPDKPVWTRAERDSITQVIYNLIDNAIKFCGQYGKITIGASAQNGILTLFVQDDGAGIKEEDLPHVFERFYKADKAHTSGLGTGLGLSIVKKILEQHGQRITVESKVGQGAKFSFTLALAKPARKEEKPARPEE